MPEAMMLPCRAFFFAADDADALLPLPIISFSPLLLLLLRPPPFYFIFNKERHPMYHEYHWLRFCHIRREMTLSASEYFVF